MKDTGTIIPKDRIPFTELKKLLSKTQLKNNVQVPGLGVVLDGAKFVKINIQTLEANSGNPAYLPYYNNLLRYYYEIKTE